jgi:hypothetical protein
MKNDLSATLAQVKTQVEYEGWQRQIQQCSSSGLNIRAWCRNNGIKPSTYYYRLRRTREQICKNAGEVRQQIVPISAGHTDAREDDAIKIKCGDITVTLASRICPESITAVIRALKQC